MDIQQIVALLRASLPEGVRVESITEETESEPVAWDFYGNVTAVEYTTSPLKGGAYLYFYWDEPVGVVGISVRVTDNILLRMTSEQVEGIAHRVSMAKEGRQSG